VTVYLLSRLNPGVVEELEMVPIESDKELQRLVSHHRTCSLINNAPFAIVDGP
jgi:hypothetical protein